ncbi:carbamoyl phosphate synthase-like protein [Nocardiopsis terrae]|uniref:Carbamoyl-phosphate synthase large subunit n=1 Tax=Nocardiopsis terrae TaxID=372655 RepID=A0ABR9HDP3_9ACTN|nr:ATP-grasp domain-containing protein [Nocardiopsis terrae]MBE1457150.1 carbamoyl-phosphate synthase large subunit [Nocardiopsis terrae]GHC90896.1 carbamoyl phosphate synthase-like protein [Nocardiopsis terrae]
MVTTAGSAPTPGTILHLREHGFRVVATDVDPAAPGLYLADRGYLVPPGGSDAFLPRMRALCAREGAVAVVPLVDEELVRVGELAGDGVAVLLPRPDFVVGCLDKYALMQRLDEAGIGVPRTWLASEWPTGTADPPVGGFVVKPRSGRGSRGVVTVGSARGVARAVAESGYAADELIVQERVTGPEYTVSVVVWRDGGVQAVVPKEVVLKQGVTRYAVTRRDHGVVRACRAVQDALRADGPFNVQLCLDGLGRPRIFEINPRFSSTAALTAAAGVDEITGLLRQAVCEGPRLDDEWREGVAMVRRWTDEFLSEEQFTSHGLSPAPPGAAAVGGRSPIVPVRAR